MKVHQNNLLIDLMNDMPFFFWMMIAAPIVSFAGLILHLLSNRFTQYQALLVRLGYGLCMVAIFLFFAGIMMAFEGIGPHAAKH